MLVFAADRLYSSAMAFLRTLLWIVATIVVVVFSFRNWMPVTVNLFGDRQADVKLPILLLIAFLLGFLPLYAWHRLAVWRHRRALLVARATSLPLEPTVLAPPPSSPAPLRPVTEAGFGPASAD